VTRAYTIRAQEEQQPQVSIELQTSKPCDHEFDALPLLTFCACWKVKNELEII